MPVIDIKPISNLKFTDSYIKNKDKTDSEIWENIREGETYDEALNSVLLYASREDKVFSDKNYYISGINCDPNHSVDEFIHIQKMFDKYGDGIVAHHGWQSFPKGYKIEPQDAHNFCVEWLKSTLGDRFQIVVTTHVDREHIHSHFIINAVSFKDGYKFYGNQETLWKLRRASDELCMKKGYPIIQNPGFYGQDQGLYRAELRGEKTWRDLVKKDIDIAIKRSDSMSSFYKQLSDMGYKIKTNTNSGAERVHPSISPPGMVKKDGSRIYIRLRSLKDPAYSLQGIEQRILNSIVERMEVPRIHRQRKKNNQVKRNVRLPRSIRRYYRFMYQAGLMQRKPRNISYYKMREYQKIAEKTDRILLYIRKYDLRAESELEARVNALHSEKRSFLTERKRLYRKKDKGEDVEDSLGNVKAEIKRINQELKICDDIKAITEHTWNPLEMRRPMPSQASQEQKKKER